MQVHFYYGLCTPSVELCSSSCYVGGRWVALRTAGLKICKPSKIICWCLTILRSHLLQLHKQKCLCVQKHIPCLFVCMVAVVLCVWRPQNSFFLRPQPEHHSSVCCTTHKKSSSHPRHRPYSQIHRSVFLLIWAVTYCNSLNQVLKNSASVFKTKSSWKKEWPGAQIRIRISKQILSNEINYSLMLLQYGMYWAGADGWSEQK